MYLSEAEKVSVSAGARWTNKSPTRWVAFVFTWGKLIGLPSVPCRSLRRRPARVFWQMLHSSDFFSSEGGKRSLVLPAVKRGRSNHCSQLLYTLIWTNKLPVALKDRFWLRLITQINENCCISAIATGGWWVYLDKAASFAQRNNKLISSKYLHITLTEY